MRITVAYNLRTDATEATAELLKEEDVRRICTAISASQHVVTPVEVSGAPNQVVERLLASDPDLIFNIAEGTIGSAREAFYPGLYEQLHLPFTGGNASLLHLYLDKHLAKTVLAAHGIPVPQGVLVTRENRNIPADLRYPLIIKPNSEGSSKGITLDSIVESAEAARRRIDLQLERYPAGLVVEEFIRGRELSVPFLEAFPGQVLGIVEHVFDLERLGTRYNIFDYEMKQGGEPAKAVRSQCPTELSRDEEERVLELARKVCGALTCPDLGRVDIRLDDEGRPWFLELNALPSLHPDASLLVAGRHRGLDAKMVMRLIIRSAARRYGLALRPAQKPSSKNRAEAPPRPTARELGIRTGRLPTGIHNAITDVPGVKVGHWTRIEDGVPISGRQETTCVRTGVTAILPADQPFRKRLVAGGFVLSGIGEMTGLMQVLELGWLETPILLTNSHSVGPVHNGVIAYLSHKHPDLGTDIDVALPVVGETDDSFLNDVRVGTCSALDAAHAIKAAKTGPVTQGSIGAGAGMMTFDFAGGIGTSSRTLELPEGNFTLGVLVLSNFGKMRNMTVDGRVVGRHLDTLFPRETRRQHSEGSIIVVIATDVPLLASQLNRIARRASLGLGRAGSYAATTSGEIIIAFSTANRSPRRSPMRRRFITLKCLDDARIDLLYEVAIETTEEAVLNAIFCSNGMSGREGRIASALPHEAVLEALRRTP